MANSPESEMKPDQSAVDNVRERIAHHRKSAEENRKGVVITWFAGSLSTATTAYFAVKGYTIPRVSNKLNNLQEFGPVIGTGLGTLISGIMFGAVADFRSSANADRQRASELEGALAQHELATNTILFEPPETISSTRPE